MSGLCTTVGLDRDTNEKADLPRWIRISLYEGRLNQLQKFLSRHEQIIFLENLGPLIALTFNS
jgi:hypothetical protein